MHVKNLMANDHTQETEFKGYIDKWFYEKYLRGMLICYAVVKLVLKILIMNLF